MKRLHLLIGLNILSTLLIFNPSTINAAPRSPAYTSEASLRTATSSLKPVIGKLKKLPDSNRVIAEALREGSITVEVTHQGMPFAAMWDRSSRKIVIDGRSQNNEGGFLCHLLFELTNAVSEPKYRKLYQEAKQGRIDCDAYVEAVEKIEHDNMVQTVEIIEKGVAAGLFPTTARWTIIYDFATHYQIQQLVGHSLLIAEEYRDLTRHRGFSQYRGTVKNLKRMSKQEKLNLAGSLYSRHFQAKGSYGNKLYTFRGARCFRCSAERRRNSQSAYS